MKFNVDSYHLKLLKDYERLAVFKEAIDEFFKDNNNSNLVYDLGCGSGVLSYLAKDYFENIISIEMISSTYKLAKENLKFFNNIEVFNQDVLDFDFNKYQKADLIICEMLDTALIDEEEVPILNYAKNFLKEDGQIIPKGIINSAEAIFMELDYLQYEDDEYQPIYDILSKSVIYSEFDFLDDINKNYSSIIEFKINQDYASGKTDYFNEKEDKIKVNGIKLSSFTKLNDNIICGPTPMLNPSILIPIEETELNSGDILRIKLEYIMGGGVETIKTEVLD